jgi:hypothetical protein
MAGEQLALFDLDSYSGSKVTEEASGINFRKEQVESEYEQLELELFPKPPAAYFLNEMTRAA